MGQGIMKKVSFRELKNNKTNYIQLPKCEVKSNFRSEKWSDRENLHDKFKQSL